MIGVFGWLFEIFFSPSTFLLNKNLYILGEIYNLLEKTYKL